MLYWFSLKDINGRVVKVYLAHDGTCPEMTGIRGLCYYESRHVILHAGFNRKTMFNTLVHELLHLCYGGLLKPGKRQEECVGYLENPMAHFMWKIGARLPSFPIGFKELAKEAKKYTRSFEGAAR